MRRYYQLSSTGKVFLIIGSIFTLGLVWLGYLVSYGFYELAYKSLKNKNEETKEPLSSFAIVSLISYGVIMVLTFLLILGLMHREAQYDMHFEPFIRNYFVILFLVTVIGGTLSVYALVQLGMRKIFYPDYQLSDGYIPCIIIGSIFTLGFCWLGYLLSFGIYEFFVNAYYKEITGHHKNLSTLGLVSIILYIILAVITLISSMFELQIINIIGEIIGVFILYGFTQFALLQMTDKTLSIYEHNFEAMKPNEEVTT